MAVWKRVLFTILVVLVKENVSVEEGKTEAITQVCDTLIAARSMNDEVAKLFNTVSLYELTKPYRELFLSGTYFHPLDKCQSGRGHGYFSDNFNLPLAQLANSAERNEVKLKAALVLKKSTTKIAELFKGAWMRIRRLYKLNEAIFDGLDEFLVDSVMNKTAQLLDEAGKDEKKDTGIVNRIINELSPEFENANALLKMMPKQILKNPEKLQNNLIYSQVHSALGGTIHEGVIFMNEDVASTVNVFSEISIKNNIKKATKKLFTTYLKGYEAGKKFSAMTNDTATRLTAVIEQAEEISYDTPCAEGMAMGKKLIDEGTALFRCVRDEQETFVEGFARDLRAWYKSDVNSLEFLRQVREAMSLLTPMVPQEVHQELDELHSYLTGSATKRDIKRIVERSRNFIDVWILKDGWFDAYEKMSKMMNKLIKVSECNIKVFQFVGKVVQSCSEGAGSLQNIYDDISSQISIDESKCWDVSLFSRPSFDDITGTVEKAARQFGFNKDCEQNTPQQDDAGNARKIVIDDYSDESEKEKFSRSQKFTICNLRLERSWSDEKINKEMYIRDLDKVKALRCKHGKKSASMYARDMQH